MKTSLFLLFLLLPIMSFPQLTKTQVELMQQSLGYIYGQDYSLRLIKSKYPDLNTNIINVQAQFNFAYGNAQENIEKQLSIALKSHFNEYKTKLIYAINEKLTAETLSKQNAIAFTEEVKKRAKGEISSPVKETLLTYQYFNAPEGEFINGYKKPCSTKGHQKSKGIDFQISVPQSWSIQEGDRPNIIQKALSQNGKGNESAMLIVSDLGTFKIANIQFTQEGLKQVLPAGCKYISGKKITLESKEGIMMEVEQLIERLDFKIKMKGLMFIIPYKTKLINIQCFTGGLESEGNIEETFDKFRPLFLMVANSLVINNQYPAL